MSRILSAADRFTFFEGVDLEYKGARGGLPRDLWETYSAFANTDGGTIWLGITQRDEELDVHGLENAERLIGDFWNLVNNRAKVSVNLLRESDVQILGLSGSPNRLVRIQVPRADRWQRPVYVGSDPMRGTYRRNFEGDFLCSSDEVRRMFADRAEDPADSRILEGFTLDDIHPESLRQYRQMFVARHQNVWLGEDDRGLLEKLGGWRRDRRSGEEGLTLAGLLMFGREQAIRDPAAVPGFHLDYRERFSDDPAVRWTDRLTLDGTWDGNLFQFYQRVMLKLSSGPGVKRPFQTDAAGYRVTGTDVVQALQEALVNALIHADHGGQGGVVIDRWVDRLEFSNPGSLLVSREQLLLGGVSECRNKSLQRMFQMLGAGDKAGSGIDRIRSSWAAQLWQAPTLSERYRPDRVVLELPMVSLVPESALRALHERFEGRFDALTADEVQAVVTAQLGGDVTNLRLQEMLTRHRVDITHMLRSLVDRGFLTSDGVGRGTRYRLPDGARASPLDSPASPLRAGAPPLSAGAPPLGAGAPPLGEGAPPPDAQAVDLIAELDDELRRIAAPVRDRERVKPEVMKRTILALCARDFLTAQQLGKLLDRSSLKSLQSKFLSSLVRAGQLILRYPDKPNHPDQAYRTAENRRKGAAQ